MFSDCFGEKSLNMLESTTHRLQKDVLSINLATHYENTSMQHTEIFKVVKNENYQ